MNLDTIRVVANILKASGELEKYSGHSDPIEAEVSYDLCEIMDSMQNIVSTFWPAVIDESQPQKAGEMLFELREELRHILYHIESSKYFSVICNSK